MEMISVQSSQISQIGFEGDILSVLFKRGELYQYEGVTEAEYELLRSGGPEKSVDKVFNATIRGRKNSRKLDLSGTWSEPKPATGIVIARGNSPVEIEQVKRESTDLVARAKAIIVSDLKSDAEAKEMLLVVRAQGKNIDQTFDPDIARWHAGHKAALSMKADFKGPIDEADKYLNAQINAHVVRERERVRLADEANRIAAKEKAEADAKAESERLAIEDAIELEASGDIAAAEAVLANPVPVPVRYIAPAVTAPAIAHVKGVSRAAVVWQIRITDAASVPDEYKVIDESMILAVVRRTNGKIRIKGVEIYEGASTSVRA